ncbi:hypothetical protein FACS1894105_04240 [Clostridia bacterium]|nr:hypothetical protein FACS1894105_04240 [Clostridia bacterium]
MKTYDIINAGPKNRFMANGRIVSNSGRLIQTQNLPQNHMTDLEQARELVKNNDFDALQMLYDSIPDVLSELIRTAFVPQENHAFIVADFSSIERVVIAWLAGEQWVLDAYNAKKDLYLATASQMFKVPLETLTKKSPLRPKAKIADLACGYGGGVGALKAFGALDMGLEENELQPIVNGWRTANSNIVKLWWEVDKAVKKAISERTTTETHGIEFVCQSGMLFITLPSGRRLAYARPSIEKNKFGSESVVYEGTGTARKWEKIESYGPKFVENITQGIARDILCYALQMLKKYRIVTHVHDEIILEIPKGTLTVSDVCELMCRTPPWAKGLSLRAEGDELNFYKKT